MRKSQTNLLLIGSAPSALEKLVQCIGGSEDRPRGNSYDDGKEQRFDGKFPTLFAREITPSQFAE